jgi:hypothetical protein
MMRARRLIAAGAVMLGVFAGSLSFAGVSALAAEGYVFAGSAGAFSLPLGVAVNESTGNVYVVNSQAGVVEDFEASGAPDAVAPQLTGATFAFAYGVAVDNSGQASKGDVYVTDLTGDVVDQFDAAGAASGVQITEANIPAGDQGNGAFEPVGVAVNSTGDVFVTDLQNDVIDEFSSAGVFIAQIGSPGQLVEPRLLAIDATNDLYVATGLGVVEYDSSGACVNSCTPVDAAAHTGVAVDGAGDVFATGEGPRVSEYDGSGALLEEFGEASSVPAFGGLGSAFGVAVNDGTHVVYVADQDAGVLDFFHTVLLAAASTGVATTVPGEAILNGTVNPEGIEVSACEFEYGPSTSYGQSAPCIPAAEAIPVDSSPHAVSAQLTGIAGEYHYRLVVGNANGESHGEDRTFTVVNNPTIDGESATAVTLSTATLEAQVNPNGLETTYAFQYATTEAGGQLTGTITTVKGESPLAAGFADQQATVTLNNLKAGQTYYYRAVATNATGTTDGPVQEFTTLPPPPAVSTGETLSVAQTNAQVTGTVNPEGLASTYEYQYGTSPTGYEQATATLEAGEGTSEVPAPGSLTDLLPNTVYYYRLLATNQDGTTYGEPHTLTTQPPTPPEASTGPANAIGQNTATIEGTVTTNGLQTNYGFEIGTEPGNYGPATGLGSLGGVTTQTVSLTLGALQPATTYHYRVVASSLDGTTYGTDQTFTTPGFPTTLTAPTTPPLIATPTITFPTETPTTTSTKPKTQTKAQKLTAALKACRREKPKSKRTKCEAKAHKQYSPTKTKKTKKK